MALDRQYEPSSGTSWPGPLSELGQGQTQMAEFVGVGHRAYGADLVVVDVDGQNVDPTALGVECQ